MIKARHTSWCSGLLSGALRSRGRRRQAMGAKSAMGNTGEDRNPVDNSQHNKY